MWFSANDSALPLNGLGCRAGNTFTPICDGAMLCHDVVCIMLCYVYESVKCKEYKSLTNSSMLILVKLSPLTFIAMLVWYEILCLGSFKKVG